MKPLLFGLFENAQANDSGTAAWRHPDHARIGFDRLAYWSDIARICEDGGLHWLFLADAWGWAEIEGARPDVCSAESLDLPRLDPAIVLAAIMPQTRRLGLVFTGSTLVEAPYAFARRVATLDHLSGGRIGWNVVTTGTAETAAAAFGIDMVDHDRRYDMADDFMELAYKLFEGAWEPGALERDRQGRFADPAKVHRVRHEGPFFSCDGYGNASYSPQGTPVLFQAGSSDRGITFASRHAECVFLGGGDAGSLRRQSQTLRAEASAFGRTDPKIVCAFSCVVGDTEVDAWAKRRRQLEAQRSEVAAASYAMFTGLDLSAIDRGTLMRSLATELSRTQLDRFKDCTVGDVLDRWHENGVRPAPIVGTAVQIADALCELADEAELDGFMLTPIVQPSSTIDFVEHVLPVLRERGAVRPIGGASTLRETFFDRGPHLPSDHPGAAFRSR